MGPRGRAVLLVNKSKIDEFNVLNSTIENLLVKIDSDFKRNKEFNENLSHELQTQLAIIRTTTENIINQNNDGEDTVT